MTSSLVKHKSEMYVIFDRYDGACAKDHNEISQRRLVNKDIFVVNMYHLMTDNIMCIIGLIELYDKYFNSVPDYRKTMIPVFFCMSHLLYPAVGMISAIAAAMVVFVIGKYHIVSILPSPFHTSYRSKIK